MTRFVLSLIQGLRDGSPSNDRSLGLSLISYHRGHSWTDPGRPIPDQKVLSRS